MNVTSFVPGIGAARTYDRSWLPRDVVAGVVLATLLVPQGMAYAELAGLPAINGLYTSILCLVGYAVFGPSRILVLGPDSSLGPMIAATILPLVAAGGDPQRAVALASILAVMVAVVMIVAGLTGLGFVADLLSKPTMIGYMNGLALTIIVGQLPKLFGFSVDADGLIAEATGFVRGLADGEAVPAAAVLGIAGIAVVLGLQRWLPKVPSVLVLVVLAIAASSIFDLASRGVSWSGCSPRGSRRSRSRRPSSPTWPRSPPERWASPWFRWRTRSRRRPSFAARTGQEVDGNQEMVGIGAANLAAGLFQGFPVSTSGSRTAVAERAGARSQLTGLVGAALIVLTIVVLPGLLRNLPQPALAAVVISAAVSLADVPGTVRLWSSARPSSRCRSPRSSRSRCSACCPGSRSPSHCRSSTCSAAPGGRTRRSSAASRRCGAGTTSIVPGRRARARARHLPVRRPADLRELHDVPGRDTPARGGRPAAGWILVAAEPITDVDTTAADMLEDLDEELTRAGSRWSSPR